MGTLVRQNRGTEPPAETGTAAFASAGTWSRDNSVVGAEFQVGHRFEPTPALSTPTLTANGFVGTRMQDGAETTGIGAHARTRGYLARTGQAGAGGRFALSADFLGADAELSGSNSEMQATLSHYTAQAAAEGGYNTRDTDNGWSFRFGLGMGEGYALRLHAADEDNDGIPEAGFGMDGGPFSIDVRSEALARASRAVNGIDVTPYAAEDEEARGVPLAQSTPAVRAHRERRATERATRAEGARTTLAAQRVAEDARSRTARAQVGGAVSESLVQRRALEIQQRWARERGQVGASLDFDEMDRSEAQARRELAAETRGDREDDVRTLTR